MEFYPITTYLRDVLRQKEKESKTRTRDIDIAREVRQKESPCRLRCRVDNDGGREIATEDPVGSPTGIKASRSEPSTTDESKALPATARPFDLNVRAIFRARSLKM